MGAKGCRAAKGDLSYLPWCAKAEVKQTQRSEAPEVTAAHYKRAEAYLDRVKALHAGEVAGTAVEAAEEAVIAAPDSAEDDPQSPADGER